MTTTTERTETQAILAVLDEMHDAIGAGDAARALATCAAGTVVFNLAPPLFSKRDPVTGHLKKMEFGGWMLNVFRVISPLKVLRGTALDISAPNAAP